MKKNITFLLLASISLMAGCKCECDKGLQKETIASINKDEAIYSDDVLREYAGQFTDYKSLLQFEYLDENNVKRPGPNKGDTVRLRITYDSQKFPQLNDQYIVHLDQITSNFKILRRIDRRCFELYVDENADLIEYHISLSYEGIKFKYAELDKDNNVTYILEDQVGLGRFYEQIK